MYICKAEIQTFGERIAVCVRVLGEQISFQIDCIFHRISVVALERSDSFFLCKTIVLGTK